MLGPLSSVWKKVVDPENKSSPMDEVSRPSRQIEVQDGFDSTQKEGQSSFYMELGPKKKKKEKKKESGELSSEAIQKLQKICSKVNKVVKSLKGRRVYAGKSKGIPSKSASMGPLGNLVDQDRS